MYQPTIIKRVLSIGLVILSTLGFLQINSVIPEFISSLNEFSENLPLLTNIIITYHSLIIGLLIFSLIASTLLANTHSIAGKYHKLGFIYSAFSPLILALFLGVVMFAMYYPIFTMAK